MLVDSVFMNINQTQARMELIKHQRAYFNSGATLSPKFRIAQLIKLKATLKASEQLLCDAIYKDFKKSAFETYETELALVYHELNLAIKKVKEWSLRQPVATNLANLPGSSFLQPHPYGVCVIIGAWNYPYQLTLSPLVAALAAGNTAIVKPSELAENSAKALQVVLEKCFEKQYVSVVLGGPHETQELLLGPPDKIFFTGSTAVGKIIAKTAAENLVPVTLELGGKSPCIVSENSDLKTAAKRIAWGKFLNAGQTCIAPDYVLVHKSVQEKFVDLLAHFVREHLGADAQQSDAYVQIINDRHMSRLSGFLNNGSVAFGGAYNKELRYIEPTVLTDISWNDPIMQEEIFGPILPVLSYTNSSDLITELKQKEKPLALYVFSNSKREQNLFLNHLDYGGATVNDTIVHIANSNLPFGGVGHSGSGAYHGEFGFKEFSHYKPVLKRATWVELPLKFPPYNNFKRKVMSWFVE